MKRLAPIVILVAVAALTFATTTYPLVVTKVETKDFRGNPRTTFRRGEIVVVETEIRVNPGYYYYYVKPISYLQIITMWRDISMLSLTLTRATVALGETKTFGGGMGIRQEDPLGTYTIEVYVWNGFPSEMGKDFAILAERKAATFTVTG